MQITAADGTPLGATVHGDGPRTLVVAGATGVPHRFYAPFARHAAAQGWAVLTFDYRGIGASKGPSVRRSRATMAEWGALDLEAALAWAFARGGAAGQAHVVAHSVGGQILPLAPNAHRVASAVLVAAQSGHWRLWPVSGRLRLLTLWYAAIPLLTAATGHFPSRLLGLGEPLPKGVARQWAHWGRHRDYLLRDGEPTRAAFARMRMPLRFVGIERDSFAPEAAVRALRGFYSAAPSELLLLPHAIGHFGFFRPGQEKLWDEALAWMVSPTSNEPLKTPPGLP